LEEKVSQLKNDVSELKKLNGRLDTIEKWALVFSAKMQTWFKAGLIIITLLMSSQVPIVKEIIGIVMK